VVTVVGDQTPAAGFRQAVAQSYLDQAALREVRVSDGGKHYKKPPTVTLEGPSGSGATLVSPHGTGASLVAVMDGTPPAADCINHYEILQGPPFDDEEGMSPSQRTQWSAWGAVEIPLVNGTNTISRTVTVWTGASKLPQPTTGNTATIPVSLTYTVTGATGTGAKAVVNFFGHGIYYAECVLTGPSAQLCTTLWNGAWGVRSVVAGALGSGYSPTDPVTITIAPSNNIAPFKTLIIEGYPPGHAKNTSTPRFSVKQINITSGGSGYVVSPYIEIRSSSGFGAYATAAVSGGAISSVSLSSGGGGYKLPPEVRAVSGEAEAFAVARPHLRGKYQCYYRYVDNTSESMGGPIPSNLSPVLEVDAGDGSASMTWTVPNLSTTTQPSRPLNVELWRSTSNQAQTLYRVATIYTGLELIAPPGSGGSLPFTDDLTDEELRNPDRSGYAAMPIVLPNGDVNAMRFTPPPNNKAVVVRYQDRFWYGVDTGGDEPNTLYFSEVDEPESVPDVNQFVLQQNSQDSDAITALVPFGSMLLIMQSRHLYSLTFAKQPLRDADVSPMASRGCMGQRCWDTYEGACYIMDRSGLYSFSASGGVKDLSAPIGDIFRTRIDFANTKWNFVLADPDTKVVRAFVSFVGDNSDGYPTRALCFSTATNTWWIERYPQRISGGKRARIANGDYKCVYSAESGLCMLDTGSVDLARGAVATVELTNRGAGYKTPPSVTAAGGAGAEFQAVVDGEGRISAIWIINPGRGYTSGPLVIGPPNDPDATDPANAAAVCTATPLNSDTPICTTYRYKSGAAALRTDASDQQGGSGMSRDINLTYRPQPTDCDLAMRMYYNNSPYPRRNVATYAVGVGFASRSMDGAEWLNMGELTQRTGSDPGVAKAAILGRTIDAMASGDRHVAVELLGARRADTPVTFYELDMYGVAPEQRG
jgi:hypothetical protein